ncbi:MAG: HEAT repeat domain-containing protein [Nannocystaceae bacterium]
MPERLDEAALRRRLEEFRARPTAAGAEALAGVDDDRVLPALVGASTDAMEGEEAVRLREALRRAATVPRLTRGLASADVDARRVAAHCLSARIIEHVPLLAVALRDADAQVRAIARRALRSWRTSPALHDLFVELLGHDDPRVRLAAALGLEKIGRPADAPALKRALAAETDAPARERMSAALQAVERGR